MAQRQRHGLAILMMVLAMLATTVQTVCVKLLSLRHVSNTIVVFASSLVQFLAVVAFVLIRRSGIDPIIKTPYFSPVITRSLAGLYSIYILYYSLEKISLPNALTLFFTMPIFTPVLTRLFWGTPIIHRLWWGIGIGFLGVVVLLHPNHSIVHGAALLALSGGISASISVIITRRLHSQISTVNILFYYFLLSALVSGVIFLFAGVQNINALSLVDATYLCGAGLFSALSVAGFTKAAKYGEARFIAPFFYCSVVFSLIPSFLIWKQIPSAYSVIGIVLIVLGSLLMYILYPKPQCAKKRRPGERE